MGHSHSVVSQYFRSDAEKLKVCLSYALGHGFRFRGTFDTVHFTKLEVHVPLEVGVFFIGYEVVLDIIASHFVVTPISAPRLDSYLDARIRPSSYVGHSTALRIHFSAPVVLIRQRQYLLAQIQPSICL